jgi:hypothetical protein
MSCDTSTPWTAAEAQPRLIPEGSTLPVMTTVNLSRGLSVMPVVLDPDAAVVFKALREAARPPYER